MGVTHSRCSIHGRRHATAHGSRARRSIQTTPENGTALSSSKLSFDLKFRGARDARAPSRETRQRVRGSCWLALPLSNLGKELCQLRTHSLKRELLQRALL